ncbi:MAG: hypothetical protein ACO3A2_05830 [Bdellovibrionia bacterium]
MNRDSLAHGSIGALGLGLVLNRESSLGKPLCGILFFSFRLRWGRISGIPFVFCGDSEHIGMKNQTQNGGSHDQINY